MSAAESAVSSSEPAAVVADIPIYIDGKEAKLPSKPVIKAGSTLVPLRSVFESMGITVVWEENSGTVVASKGGDQLRLQPGQRAAQKNGKTIQMAVASELIEGSTYVPLRFIGESFQTLVGYDQGSRTISISTKPFVKAKVLRVVDGDTLEVSVAGSTKKVRAIGVNTPESTTKVEVGGPEASAYTKSRLTGQTVYLTRDQTDDPYGRMLAYIHLQDGEFFNATLASEGYARVMTIAPNTTWADYYELLEGIAHKNGRQVWNASAAGSGAAAEGILKQLSDAGIEKAADGLSGSVTEKEFSTLLLYAFFPEARLLLAGYKIYEVAKDEESQQIIEALLKAGTTGELDSDMLRKLVFLGLGVEEGSFLASTIDELGLLPSQERPLNIAEAVELVNTLQAFKPSVEEAKKKLLELKEEAAGLGGIQQYIEDANLKESLEKTIGDLDVKDKLQSAGTWIKGTVGGLFGGEKPSTADAEKAATDVVEKANAIKEQISLDALKLSE
ncbi:stalk domain-containing protein [Paenibacillus mucilaginosus]|uniref:stalk domain-containing protein n=1 Tax=Paenibacillus mucilaginosus TaxID=61624 RepID=UPI003D1D29C4